MYTNKVERLIIKMYVKEEIIVILTFFAFRVTREIARYRGSAIPIPPNSTKAMTEELRLIMLYCAKSSIVRLLLRTFVTISRHIITAICPKNVHRTSFPKDVFSLFLIYSTIMSMTLIQRVKFSSFC